jgi:hypothetical protein
MSAENYEEDLPPEAPKEVYAQKTLVGLVQLLTELFFERGERVYEWPEDEAEAYREFGWSEGRANARRVMFKKNAKAIVSSSWLAGLKRQWQAEALEEASQMFDGKYFYQREDGSEGHYLQTHTQQRVQRWLRARAAELRAVPTEKKGL